MMDTYVEDHLARLEYQIMGTMDISGIPDFITSQTYIKGAPYSFKDHEFQLKILSDTAVVSNTQKCSQIGLTEAQARWGLAALGLIPDFSIIYTFPFSGDAENFAKTRVDQIVEMSPRLNSLKDKYLWNSSIKRIGTGTIYFKGTNSETAAISTPADCIISDEIDRSNPDVLEQYESRLTHSEWRLRRNFSTPTVEKRGIHALMAKSKRWKNLCKCQHCGTWAYPDYYKNVVVPGWYGDLRDINKNNLHLTRYLEATVICLHCSKPLNLYPANREWVCENPSENYEASGHYVSPFDAPALISPSFLIEKSTKYRRVSEFINQNLGLTAEEAADAITTADLEAAWTHEDMGVGPNVMGADMGMTCNIAIGRVVQGNLLVVHHERVPLGEFEKRRKELMVEYRVIGMVQDAMPYTDLVMRIQRAEANAYGAYYVDLKANKLFDVKEINDDPEDEQKVRAINIQKNMAFDEVLYLFKNKQIKLKHAPDKTLFDTQMQDMKKIPQIDKFGEIVYKWEKSSDGNDHYHHTLVYLLMATKLPFSSGVSLSGVPLVSSFRNRSS